MSDDLGEYDTEFRDEEGHFNSWTKVLPQSEYEKYCMAQNIAFPYPKYDAPFQDFLFKKKLTPREKDLEHYPGIQHAAQLLSHDTEAEDGDTLSLLDEERQYMLMNVLNSKYSAELAKDKFCVGESVPSEFKGGRWTILTRLNNVSGSFNRGVYLVKFGKGICNQVRLMKTLPSPAHYPGFASREISIVSDLEHQNILQYLAGNAPEGRHETGWLITDYCNKGTLKTYVQKYIWAKQAIPEVFIWHIFESLVRAVCYMHTGTDDVSELNPVFTCGEWKQNSDSEQHEDPWDPVYHRDIILDNVFCTTDTTKKTRIPVIKLGDFGCALRESEVKDLDAGYPWARETPIMDNHYVPPEGPLATAAVDIYQIGLLVSCLVQTVLCPSQLDATLVPPEKRGEQSSSAYSRGLRTLLFVCLCPCPVDRINATALLQSIQATRPQ
ncbi:nek protein kinase [Stemphylium lycopersici]|uniref:non-specific serine/threonine protein kinase n=1 Tax=Stemphylium lycopersici TaxID=183478 RepID=A0A364N7A4_STELY|nr:nek protein kinase [Stemphylium lycopersici]RAR13205.1 kinase-like protein [Stemphylium lycopersici]